jgi:hypothetical protein
MIMTTESIEVMPEDVRQVFWTAVQLYAHWTPTTGAPLPTVQFRNLVVSLSGVCDLIFAYKNEAAPTLVSDELWRLMGGGQTKLKAELAMDPSYTTAAKCLNSLVQTGQLIAAVSKALVAANETDLEL